MEIRLAITKLLRIKETAGRSKAKHLKNNIFYICNPEKTDNGSLIGGNAGLDAGDIYKVMIRNKKSWNKESGSQAFHYMLSFPPDSGVSEELAYTITQEFCAQLLGEDFYHVFAVHNDREHMHSHITFDSVSRADGHKFHSPAGDWKKRIQPITDTLCQKYSLPTLSYDPKAFEGRKHKNYRDWKTEKGRQPEGAARQEKYTWADIIKDDIDEAIKSSKSYDDFLLFLKNNHYEMRDKKYLSLKPYGKEGSIRSHQLGNGYTKADITKRIEQSEFEPALPMKTYGERAVIYQSIQVKLKVSSHQWRMTDFQKRFYRRWNFTYFIRKPGFKDAWKYKKDVLRVHKLTEEFCYMIEHDITDLETLSIRKNALEVRKKELRSLCRDTRKRIYKDPPLRETGQYISIKEELGKYPEGSRRDLEEKLRELVEQIETVLPFDSCRDAFLEEKGKLDGYKREQKSLTKEFSILSGIEHEKLELPDIGWNLLDKRKQLSK